MTFIKKQSVAFNILNNVGPDSTAEYIEKGKRGQIGEIRTWSDGKYRKTASGWEPVKESLQASSEEKVDLKEEVKRVEGKNGFTDLDGVWHNSSNPKEDVRYKKKMSEEGRKAFEKEYAQPGSEAAEEQEYDSLLSKLESKVGRGISDILDSSSKEDLKDLLHEEHNLKYSDEQISKIFNMSKKLKADSHFKVNGQTYKQIVGEDSTKEGLKGDKKEDSHIVDNVNNGEIINSLFKEWNSIKTSEQHEKWAKRVANTKFGTYKDKTILNVMSNFNSKFPNEIVRKDFINEVQEAYKNSGGE